MQEEENLDEIFNWKDKRSIVAKGKPRRFDDQVIEDRENKLDRIILKDQKKTVSKVPSSDDPNEKMEQLVNNVVSFYDPMEDLNNEMFIQKASGHSSLKFKGHVSCPNCFTPAINSNYSFVFLDDQQEDNKVRFCVSKEIGLLDVSPQVIVQRQFGLEDSSGFIGNEINFLVRCRECQEDLGFYNFNSKKAYLGRFLE